MDSTVQLDDEATVLIALVIHRRKKRRQWVHPYLQNAEEHSLFITSKQLEQHDDKFQNLYRMRKETFHRLVTLLRPNIQRKDTNFRRCVPTEERLLIFLRYLSSGMSFSALQHEFFRGISTISAIVEDTAKNLWTALQPTYMKFPSQDKWLEISNRYYELSRIPNCIGAIDGKHVRIKCPTSSGSGYYNYKGFYSIVLMACSDADGCFTFITAGDFGRNSDGPVIRESGFIKALSERKLNIPSPSKLPNEPERDPFPYYFVADEAFSLNEHIMKPYARKNLTNPKRMFNKRLSIARKSVECAFGMMVSKFRLFETPIACDPSKVEAIVKAACVLHNYCRKHDGILSTPRTDEDIAAANALLAECPRSSHGRSDNAAVAARDRLCDHFLSPNNVIYSQFSVCVNETV